MSAGAAPLPARAPRAWPAVGALSVTEIVSWGVLYYAFAALLVPMQADLGAGPAALAAGFSIALAVSALAGLAVGRHVDRHGARGVMTAGSVAGALLVLAWSQVQDLAAFYAVWAGIGVVMAAVLYEPAFAVLAKAFGDPAERRRAMTAMTLAGALASLIFVPLADALASAWGWRDALVALAVVLAATTIPLHARAVPAGPGPAPPARALPALRTRSFRLLALAFPLAALATVAMTVHTIPFLVERGHSPAAAAWALGLIGASQIPGRLLFGAIAARCRPAVTAAVPFGLIALGIATAAATPAPWPVVAGLVLLGMGNGMGTLARATMLAELYGTGAYGTIGGVAAAGGTLARASGPVLAALYAAALGYGALLWTLAGLAAAAAALAHRAVARHLPT